MTEKKERRESNTPFRHDLTEEEKDLGGFLAELQQAEGGASPPAPSAGSEADDREEQKPEPPAEEKPAPPRAPSPMSRYDELRNARGVSMEKDDLCVYTDFSSVIGKIHAAQQTIEGLRRDFPDILPERSFDTWIGNLKETQMVMMREFHALRNGRREKKYDKRCICVRCFSVFLVPLPADGLCDECRAAAQDAPKPEEK